MGLEDCFIAGLPGSECFLFLRATGKLEKINSKRVAPPFLVTWAKKSGIPRRLQSQKSLGTISLSSSISPPPPPHCRSNKSSQSEMKSLPSLSRQNSATSDDLEWPCRPSFHGLFIRRSGHSPTLMSHFHFPNGSCLVGSIYSSRPNVSFDAAREKSQQDWINQN